MTAEKQNKGNVCWGIYWSPTMQQALDLSFQPVVNPAPRRLTPAQIALYNEVGFVAPFDAIPREEMVAVRAYFDRLLEDMGPDGAMGINCYQARLGGLWDIATDARILDYVEDIVGPTADLQPVRTCDR